MISKNELIQTSQYKEGNCTEPFPFSKGSLDKS